MKLSRPYWQKCLSQSYNFFYLVLKTLLIIGGVELNPGPKNGYSLLKKSLPFEDKIEESDFCENEKDNNPKQERGDPKVNVQLKKEITSACETGDWTECKKYLEKHLPNNSVEYRQLQNLKESGCLPLAAAEKGHVKLIKHLLLNGLPINKIYYSEWKTMLHKAAVYGHCDLLFFLLTRGADVHVRDMYGGTPLHWAAREGHSNSVKLLLDHGADINAINLYGNTPLHRAVFCGRVSVVECLVMHDCDKFIATKDGKTALNIAEEKGYDSIKGILCR